MNKIHLLDYKSERVRVILVLGQKETFIRNK